MSRHHIEWSNGTQQLLRLLSLIDPGLKEKARHMSFPNSIALRLHCNK